MTRKYFFFCFISFTILLAGPAKSQHVFGPEEHRVYETVVSDWLLELGGKGLLIRDRTASMTKIQDLEKELIFVKDSFAGLREETTGDFKAKSIDSYQLAPLINDLGDYRFISHNEIVECFRYKDGWDRFYQRYPDSAGVFTFSRVGLNRYKNQALVCVNSQWGDFSGSGVYLLLNKDDTGVWKITQKVRIWHSWISEEDETRIRTRYDKQVVF